MRKIRILLVSGFSAYFKQGGGEVEAASLCRCLNAAGFEADLYGPDVFELDSYDLVIFFSCHYSGLELLENCKEMGVRFLFWPNFWIKPGSTPSSSEVETINKFCANSDRIVFKSRTEILAFEMFFSFDKSKPMLVNWFIDDGFGLNSDPNKFKALYGLDSYILSVGLIEPIKNQLTLIEAVVAAGVKLVLIGGFRTKEYFDNCLKVAAQNVVFIPHLPINSPILVSAYAGCDAYVEISLDPPGRSAIEAALFGKPIILSKSLWVDEIFPQGVTAIDSDDRELLISYLADYRKLEKMGSTSTEELLIRHSPSQALEILFDYVHSLRAGW